MPAPSPSWCFPNVPYDVPPGPWAVLLELALLAAVTAVILAALWRCGRARD